MLIEAPGRAPLRYPVLVGRGEHVTLRAELPTSKEIPDGFVYIPSGSFMFGNASSDDLARKVFFATTPIHTLHTDSYLIARYETTFAEWIEYLEALSPAERALRMPRGDSLWGTMKLDRRPNGSYRLSMKPLNTYYESHGDVLTYAGRAHNATQQWRRFPVSGVSFVDASAYAAWLSKTGRVPGARLCTELEWERAARGADDRWYPHGETLEDDDANVSPTYGSNGSLCGPDEVGLHRASDSPFGVSDMVGNIWELVAASITQDKVVARGGAFAFDTLTCRIENRQTALPDNRGLNVGVRICADPPTGH
jgi:formylglycine-generating enzyme required for sulfatase activity